MSSLWTPGGEHQVEREPAPDEDGGGPAGEPADAQAALEEELAKLTPEQRAVAEERLAAMAQVQQQILEAPPEVVVANHAMGLYELAAIHLSQESPDFEAAQLAIDGMAGLVEGLKGRLAETEPELNAALQQIRLAFVQVKERVDG